MKKLLVVGMAILTFSSFGVAEAGAQARSNKEPVRSGQILGGIYSTGPWGCWLTPDCELWHQSGCDPAMTGRQEPAVFTSIVDVEDLAGLPKVRRFLAMPQDPLLLYYGGTVIEFWSADCNRLQPVDSRNWVVAPAGTQVKFRIPSGATWMTVVSSDCVRIGWTLT